MSNPGQEQSKVNLDYPSDRANRDRYDTLQKQVAADAQIRANAECRPISAREQIRNRARALRQEADALDQLVQMLPPITDSVPQLDALLSRLISNLKS